MESQKTKVAAAKEEWPPEEGQGLIVWIGAAVLTAIGLALYFGLKLAEYYDLGPIWRW